MPSHLPRSLLHLARLHGWSAPPSLPLPVIENHVRLLLEHHEDDLARIVAPIYVNLKAHRLLDHLDPETSQKLHHRYLAAIQQDLLCRQTLDHLSTFFAEAEIPAILLKGHALNQWVYPAEAPRLSTDIDLLIHPKHLRRADQILRAHGATATALPDPDRLTSHPKEKEWLYSLNRGDLTFGLDLHWRPTPRILAPWDMDELFIAADRYQHKVGHLLLLPPEEALVTIALHAITSLIGPLHALLDAHELVCTLRPDIAQTITLARRLGVSRGVAAFLHRLQEEMDTPITMPPPDHPLLQAATDQFAKQYLLSDHWAEAPTTCLRYSIIKAAAYAFFTNDPRRGLCYAVSQFSDRSNRFCL